MTDATIFIDGSYFCFYRYYSIMNWWKNAYPEIPIEDPFLNEAFVAKFRKTFVDHVSKLQKNLGIHKSVKPTIIVGKDCKRENIWRNELFPQYKANLRFRIKLANKQMYSYVKTILKM